jgi:hypothetical protein
MRLSMNLFRHTERPLEKSTIRALQVAACVVAVGGVWAVAQSAANGTATSTEAGQRAEHDGALQACSKACSDCQRECDSCGTHCAHLLSKGNQEHLATLMTCQDCATICAAASQIVARGGPFSATICDSCATACAECAKACAKNPDDRFMQACAEECRKCEKACRSMLKHTGSN